VGYRQFRHHGQQCANSAIPRPSVKWTIKSPVELEKKIVQNDDLTDGEGTINSQKVIDLKYIDSIYVNVQAVKTSAQAEANTLCKYAKDLQEQARQWAATRILQG